MVEGQLVYMVMAVMVAVPAVLELPLMVVLATTAVGAAVVAPTATHMQVPAGAVAAYIQPVRIIVAVREYRLQPAALQVTL